MNFIEELGPLALGSRIKNLSELLMKDMSKVYKDHGIEFEARWFTLFQLVLKREKISVTEIASELNQSHPAVVQVVNVLEKKKLISTVKDRSDHRRRLVKLSKKGKTLAEQLSSVWEDVLIVANEILNEEAPDLLEKISGLEKALQGKSVYERMSEKRIERIVNSIEFKPFTKEFQDDFRRMNEDWLRSYLEITEHDRKNLMDPFGEIIASDGLITLMVSDEQPIGSFVLKRISNTECELSKFTIHKNYRGIGLGTRLLEKAIEEAGSKGYHSILLFTHHKLAEATKLYSKKGFKEISEHPAMVDETGRCSMMMKLNINQ